MVPNHPRIGDDYLCAATTTRDTRGRLLSLALEECSRAGAVVASVGDGARRRKFRSGVFQVSNIDSSTRMWNAQIPRDPSAALGLGCDVEHLRGVLDEIVDPVYPRANELFWLTDATPHESLPLEKGTYRQYFRLVTSEVSAWWEQHSTKNRLGIQPGCTILKHSKFGKDAYLGFRHDSGDDEGERSPLNRKLRGF